MVALVVGAVSSLSLSSWPGTASAASTSCATPPSAYTGADQTVAAITQLNIDADQNCQAVTDRLDSLDGDLRGGNTQAHGDAQAINGTLTGWNATNPLQVTLPGGGSGQAVQVTNWPGDQTVALDSTTSSTLDGQQQSLHGDLWVLIGVIVGVFALDVFLRKVWP